MLNDIFSVSPSIAWFRSQLQNHSFFFFQTVCQNRRYDQMQVLLLLLHCYAAAVMHCSLFCFLSLTFRDFLEKIFSSFVHLENKIIHKCRTSTLKSLTFLLPANILQLQCSRCLFPLFYFVIFRLVLAVLARDLLLATSCRFFSFLL